MNIDTLNAYCRLVLVTGLPLCQGRLNDIHQEILSCIVSVAGSRAGSRDEGEPGRFDLLHNSRVYSRVGSVRSLLVARGV